MTADEAYQEALRRIDEAERTSADLLGLPLLRTGLLQHSVKLVGPMFEEKKRR